MSVLYFLGLNVDPLYHRGMDSQIANNIYRRRTELGLSEQELAERLGVTQPTISRYESGDRTPSIEFLRVLAQELKVSMSEILGEK